MSEIKGFSETVFLGDGPYADMLRTAVDMVNSASTNPEDPMVTLSQRSLGQPDRLIITLGFMTTSGSGSLPNLNELCKPVGDAMTYLHARPAAADDTF